MNLGQKIEQLLKTTAMTKVELAKKLGLKDSSVISHWVKNRFKPDRENIAKLSVLFDKPVSYFADDDLYCEETSPYPQTEKKVYELFSNLPAATRVGVQGEAEHDFFDIPLYSQAEEFLPIMLEGSRPQPFAIKILAEEACPWARKGEYLILVAPQQIQNGKLYLVKTRKGYIIRKVYLKENSVSLKDFSNKIKSFQSDEVQVAAKVLAFYRKTN